VPEWALPQEPPGRNQSLLQHGGFMFVSPPVRLPAKSKVLTRPRTPVISDGSTRELYHYVSRVGVAWSGNNFIIVTDYVNKKTARALVFRIDRPDEYLVLDKTNLAARIPDERRIQLERNDHAFLEVSRMEGSMLTLRVWGYGAHDPQGFRFQCAYELDQGTTTCRDMVAAGAKP
jgi:hypothetical protein